MEEIAHYFFNIGLMIEVLPTLLRGLFVTLQLSVLIIVLGLLFGFVLAVVRAFQIRLLNIPILVCVDVFRAAPPLVIVIFLYFGLPYAGISIPPFWCVVLALAGVLAALAEEIFWAGILSVDDGQWDAGFASGLGFTQVLLLIVVRQTVRFVIPPLTNKVISITKQSALASVVAVPELLNQAITAQGVLANPSPLTAAALLFLVVFLPLVRFTTWLERRYTVER